MGFGGFQAGIDLGRFNLGATGLNIVFGVTGGLLDATDQEQISPGGTFTFTVPFVGGYAAATKGNFFADVLVREDFYQIDTTATSVGLSNAGLRGNAINVMGEAGYRYDLGGSYFVEPSIGLIWSHLNLGSLNTPNIPGANGSSLLPVGGVFTFNPIDSLIGRAGVRVGTSFNAGDIGLQPFVAASVWDEFAGDTASSFVCNCQLAGGVPTGVNISSTRVGTFGQFGLGTAAQILNTGWLGFVRADYRTGENIQGWDLTGGIRYQFAIFSPPPPLVTKN
jgi:outer membrane autotransporter protein